MNDLKTGLKLGPVTYENLQQLKKKSVRKIFIIGKTSNENADKMNEKYLLRKL